MPSIMGWRRARSGSRWASPGAASWSLTARRERDKVLVEVSDDGAGFDARRLRRRAVDMGLLSAEKVAELTEQQSYELAFLPGLSTRAEATDLSGRGVGSTR